MNNQIKEDMKSILDNRPELVKDCLLYTSFNCFKSRDKVAWVNWNPSFANSCNNSSWLPTSLLEIIILMASSLLFLLFILHNYSNSAAKLQNIREYRYKKENIFATLCIFSTKLLSIIPRINQNHTKFSFQCNLLKKTVILCFTTGTTKSNSYNIKKTRTTFGE